mmetsp:Transcript_29614/g.53053  ORF Transcript_29614/g.53053 Transcript_29614/m.53053 type:complete len:287 (-) Transcript_29614:261-1121(-)
MFYALPLIRKAIRFPNTADLHQVLIGLVRVASFASPILLRAAKEHLAGEGWRVRASGPHANLFFESAQRGKSPARAALTLRVSRSKAPCASIVVEEVVLVRHLDAICLHLMDECTRLGPDALMVLAGALWQHRRMEVVAKTWGGTGPGPPPLLRRQVRRNVRVKLLMWRQPGCWCPKARGSCAIQYHSAVGNQTRADLHGLCLNTICPLVTSLHVRATCTKTAQHWAGEIVKDTELPNRRAGHAHARRLVHLHLVCREGLVGDITDCGHVLRDRDLQHFRIREVIN